MSVVVFGSVNMDLVTRVLEFPKPGETLTGLSFQTFPGGKGANQAVACARLETPTKMVGRVGSDAFGQTLRNNLKSNQVDIQFLQEDENTSSGVAVITVNEKAENQIIVIPGANGEVGGEDLDRLQDALADAQILLLQLEVPMWTVSRAAEMAHQRGVTVILDPAPAQPISKELIENINYITPNQVEAAMLVGFPIHTEKEAQKACQSLMEQGIENVIIKMGENGVLYANQAQQIYIPAIPVKAVDTVAAGDAFNGALAAGLAAGLPVEDAIHWGTAGGAWSVTRAGAQTSLPYLNELKGFLRRK